MLYILVGYIFDFFHIKINEFDLLADFVGYILIYLGLTRYAAEVKLFEKAKPFALLMSALTLVGGFMAPLGLNFSSFLILLNLVSIVGTIYILYLIDMGVRELEQTRNQSFNSDTLLLIWKVQTALMIACAMFSLIRNQVFAVITAILSVAAIIANIVFLLYLFRAYKLLETTTE